MADLKLKVAGHEYVVPVTYTIAEARTIKSMSGFTLREFRRQMAEDASDPDCLAALILIAAQRDNPSVTLADIEQVSLEDVEFVGGDAVPPDDAATAAPESAATSST